MRALLDVNVLIALLDSDHLHHTQSHGLAAGEYSIGLGFVPADRERLYPDHVATRLPPTHCRAGP
jgi:hypothetical protein